MTADAMIVSCMIAYVDFTFRTQTSNGLYYCKHGLKVKVELEEKLKGKLPCNSLAKYSWYNQQGERESKE